MFHVPSIKNWFRGKATDFNKIAEFLNNLCGQGSVRVYRPDIPSNGSPPTISLDIEKLQEELGIDAEVQENVVDPDTSGQDYDISSETLLADKAPEPVTLIESEAESAETDADKIRRIGVSHRAAREDHVHRLRLTQEGILYSNGTNLEYKSIGTAEGDVAAGNHDHDEDYAAIDHDHDEVYQPLGTVPEHEHDASAVTGLGELVESHLDAALVLTEDDIGESVQEYSSKLAGLEEKLTDSGQIPLAMIDGSALGDHSGTCLVTIDDSGKLGHTGNNNRYYSLLNEAVSRNNNGAKKLLTDLDAGDGLTIGEDKKLHVQCVEDGGITLSDEGLAIGGFSETDKFLKTDGSGNVTVADTNPVTVPSTINWSGMFSSVTGDDYNTVIYFNPPTFDKDGKLTGFNSASRIQIAKVCGPI